MNPAEALGLLDLAESLVWAVAFALAGLAYVIANAIAGGIDINIPLVGRPFHGVAVAFRNAIVTPLGEIAKGSAANVARGFMGLWSALVWMLEFPFLLAGGIIKAFTYLWKHALKPLIHSLVDWIAVEARKAVALVATLEQTVTGNVVKAERYADAQASHALSEARSYAEGVATTAERAAERYADNAVSTLRRAEDAAVANAVRLADEARAAGVAAASQAASEAEALAAHALAASEATASAALGQVKAIAIGAEGELTDLEAYIKSLSIPAALAGSAALATLLTVVLTETGLENQSCRSKVKGICGTDPSAWLNLLEGAALIGVGLSLSELVKVGRAVIDESVGFMQAVA